MEMKPAIVLLALLVVAVAPLSHGEVDSSPQAVERWFRRFHYAKPKLTKLHFFLHDLMNGTNPTTVPIAEASMTASSPTTFGRVFAMDSPLTVGPELTSTLIGRVQGLFTFASQESRDLLITMNFVFTDGPYAGSTLSLLGDKKLGAPYREYAVTGGTGVFRLAEGVVIDWPYSRSVVPGNRPPTECQVFVSHYSVPDFVDDIEMNPIKLGSSEN